MIGEGKQAKIKEDDLLDTEIFPGLRRILMDSEDIYQHIRIKVGATILLDYKHLVENSDNYVHCAIVTSFSSSSIGDGKATINMSEIPDEVS